jgi:HEAT repeat protein
LLLLLSIVSCAQAQTTQPATTAPATQAAGEYPSPPIGYGTEDINIPTPGRRNGTRPRTVQLLGEAISRLENGQRVQLIRDLGACQMSDALKFLESAASDPNPLVRAEVARSAGLIGDKAFLPTLTKMLADESAKVRREVVIAGGKLGDASFATEGLKSDDPQILAAAMEAASTPEHAETIAGRLPNLPAALQVQALAALGRLGATDHSAAVAGFADDSVPLAAASMRSLREMKAADQVQVVIATLAHAHPTVRRDAVTALATTATPQVRQEQAIRMLKDPDPTVREEASNLLRDVPLAAGVAPLVDQLDDGYAPLHHAAREALVAAADDAIPSAVKLLDHADPRRREDGSYILGQLKSDAGLERHIALLTDADWDLVAQVARSLGDIGRHEADKPLAELLKKAKTAHQITPGKTAEEQRINNSAIRAMSDAVIASGKLRVKEILPPLIDIIPERQAYPYQLRAAVIWAFGVMGDPNDTATCDRMLPMYGDLFEATEVKFEALKALGNIGYKPSAASLKGISETDFSPNLRWIAFWSHRVITGEPTEYVNPVIEWLAEVSISDLPAS